MLNIPEEIRDLLKQDSVKKNFRVHFPNGESEDITNSKIVSESVQFRESICSQNELRFGLCESPQIEFETVDVGNIKGATIECSYDIDVTGIPDTKTYTNNGKQQKSVDELKSTSNDVEFIIDFNLFGWQVAEDTSLAINVHSCGGFTPIQPAGGSSKSISYKVEYSINNEVIKKTITKTTKNARGDTSNHAYWYYLDDVHTIQLKANDTIQYIKVYLVDYRYPVTQTNPPVYRHTNSNISYDISLPLTFCAKEKKSDLSYFSYSIPLGTFIVDSCKKQADMTHRQVVAYPSTDGFILTPFLQNFFSHMTWVNKTIKFSMESFVKMLLPSLNENFKLGTKHDDEGVTTFTLANYYSEITQPVSGYKLQCKMQRYYISNSHQLSKDSYIAHIKTVIDNRFTEQLDSIRAYIQNELSKQLPEDDRERVVDEFLNAPLNGGISYYDDSYGNFVFPNMVQYDYITYNTKGNPTTYYEYKLKDNDKVIYALDEGSWQDIKNHEMIVPHIYSEYISKDTSTQFTGWTLSTAYDWFFVPVEIRLESFWYELPEQPFVTVLASTDDFTDLNYLLVDDDVPIDTSPTNIFFTPNQLKKTYSMLKYDLVKGGVSNINQVLYDLDFGEIINRDWRDLLQAWCELQGLFGAYSRTGGYTIKSINDNFNPPNASILTPNDYSALWYEDEDCKPIGRIDCYYNSSQDEVSYAYYDLVDDYNSKDYKSYSISNNYFIQNNIYDEVHIQAIFQAMAQNIGNITYMPMELTIKGRPDVEAGDVFDVQLKDGTSFKGFVEQRTLTGVIALSDDITSKDEYTSQQSGSSGGSYSGGGGGTGAVTSVNGYVGAVQLTANDVNALPNTTVIPTSATLNGTYNSANKKLTLTVSIK